MDRPSERFAVAVVRAWIEAGPPDRLKVRIMTSPGIHEQGRTLRVAADAQEACSIIRAWLDAFAADASSADEGASS